MKLSLSKNNDVPLRQQLTEQIVTLIATGQIARGEQLPSVRTLARQLNIHHNTVSEAYQDLVRRGWLSRKRGTKLVVGTRASVHPRSFTLDELINETIQRATETGYTLQALTKRVRERLQQEPADHVLVVEEEEGLRKLICREVLEKVRWPVESCSPGEFAKEPDLCVGAQVFAPRHLKDELKTAGLEVRPPIWITYSTADEHLELIRSLRYPSTIGAASLSASLLKAARSFFAPALGRRHAFQAFLLVEGQRMDLGAVDVLFCDSMTIKNVRAKQKVPYPLVSSDCLQELASTLAP